MTRSLFVDRTALCHITCVESPPPVQALRRFGLPDTAEALRSGWNLMKTIHKLSLLLALLLISPLTFFAADVAPEAEAEFIGKIKDACVRRDVDAVLALYYWSGANEKTKRDYRSMVERLLQHSISNVRIVPAKRPQLERFSDTNGTTYQPGLPQVRKVEFLFGQEEGKEPDQASWGFPLGIKDGKLQIIAIVPKAE